MKAESEKKPETGSLPEATLGGLVLSLSAAALAYMGEKVAPEGQNPDANLVLARHTIGTLEMLKTKTEGNRTPDENKLFDEMLYQLRMAYVQAEEKKSGGTEDQTVSPQAATGPSEVHRPSDLQKFLGELLTANPGVASYSEAEVQQGVVLPLLRFLGWHTDNPSEVHPQHPVGSGWIDYSLRVGGNDEVFVEVKPGGHPLGRPESQEQLLKYSFQQGVSLAVLTNGLEWWFYSPMAKGDWLSRCFRQVALSRVPDQGRDGSGREDEETGWRADVDALGVLLAKKNIESGESEKASATMLGKRAKIAKQRQKEPPEPDKTEDKKEPDKPAEPAKPGPGDEKS